MNVKRKLGKIYEKTDIIAKVFYAQLLVRFKLDKQLYSFEGYKTVFEMELCINDAHVITKMNKLLLKHPH